MVSLESSHLLLHSPGSRGAQTFVLAWLLGSGRATWCLGAEGFQELSLDLVVVLGENLDPGVRKVMGGT